MVFRTREQLVEILNKIDRPGTFCTSGLLPPTLPGLEVTGAGPVGLPLETQQAAALKKLARQAPYGKGTQTLVDTSVRRVWEIDAASVVLANPDWDKAVEQAVAAVQSGLGLKNQKLDAHLYKLLLYEPGSFFRAHRDGEKLDRMVATLVIALPSAHAGGELIVRHEGQEEIVDFSPQSRFQTQFAAFYADCEHEIRPVTSGFRLTLAYNLTLAKSKQAIAAPVRGKHIAAVASVLERWKQALDNYETLSSSDQKSLTNKLAVLLDYEYTQPGLTYDALKGIDRVKASVLFAAARQAGCDASLAMVTEWLSGSAEVSGGHGHGYGRYGYDDGDDDGSSYEMGEVFDGSLTVEHFSDAEGNRLAFGQIPLDEDEIVSETPLNAGEPTKEDFEGFTGNAGMTLERWYHRAAIMLWPAELRFDVLCEAGVEAAVGGLEPMVRQWKQASQGEQAALKQPCLEFAYQIIANWPEREHCYRDDAAFDYDDFDDEDADDDGLGQRHGATGPVARHPLISLVEELDDVSLIAAWLRGVLANDASVDPGKTLGDICQRHGWATFQDELLALFENTSNETLERNARLLADWSLRKDKVADLGRLCSQLGRHFMSALQSWNPQPSRHDWQSWSVNREKLLPPLAEAFLALEEPELLERLVTYVLDRPEEYDLTTVQIPALLSMKTWLKQNVKRASAPLQCWLTAVHAELESRASNPPQEPADWRRAPATGCGCSDCKQLGHFLEDPNTQTIRLPMAKDRRQHLHRVIDGQKLDLTHLTERRGRPYTLVCTKTQASYQRALQAHHVDVDRLAKISRLLEWHTQLSPNSERLGSDVPKKKAPKKKTAKKKAPKKTAKKKAPKKKQK